MKTFLTIALLISVHFSILSQTKTTKGTLSSTELVNVDVIKVIPGKIPHVSLVFRAETLDGEPVWDLKKEDFIIKEDSLNCTILSIESISKNKPINIGMVIDHSGSMGSDSWMILDILNIVLSKSDSSSLTKTTVDWTWSDLLDIFSKGDSIIPLEYAKSSARTFVSSFNAQKDYMSIVAFGEKVDLKIPLNNDTTKTNQAIGEIKLGGSTALYDGMMAAMKQLKKAHGLKILVVLTDGHENSSSATLQNVIDYSVAENIPIYLIGLGFVDIDELNNLALATKGQFFYTKKSSSLVEIYQKISKQIQSFYAIEYASPNVSTLTLDKKPEVKIAFDVNSIYLKNDPTDPEVVAYLEKKEYDRKLWYYGKIAVGVMVVAGAIVLIYSIRRRRKNRKGEAQKI